MSYEMTLEEKTAFLLESSAWAGLLDLEEARETARILKTARLSAGENLFGEGDAGDFLAFVVTGRVRIIKKNIYFRKKIVAELCEGHIVGEIALIDGSPRSAAAFCLTPAVFLTLNRERLDRLARDFPRLGYKLMTLLCGLICHRLRETTKLYVDLERACGPGREADPGALAGRAGDRMRRFLG